MTMNQDQKQALQQNWEQAKNQVRSTFQGVTDEDLSDPSTAADRIAQRTGQDRNQVEQQLSRIAEQAAGGSTGAC